MLAERVSDLNWYALRHGSRPRMVESALTWGSLLDADNEWDIAPLTPSNRHLLLNPYQQSDVRLLSRLMAERHQNEGQANPRAITSRASGAVLDISDSSSQVSIVDDNVSRFEIHDAYYCPSSSQDGQDPCLAVGDMLACSESSEEIDYEIYAANHAAKSQTQRASGDLVNESCVCESGTGCKKGKLNLDNAKAAAPKIAKEELPPTFRWVQIEIV